MFSSLSITCKIKVLKKQVSDFDVDSSDEVGQGVGFNTPMGTLFFLQRRQEYTMERRQPLQ